MDSAEQHIHLWRAITLAGALQDKSLFIIPSHPAEMDFFHCPQIAAPVCFMLFVAPKDGGVCRFHAFLPCNSICLLLAVQGKAFVVDPVEANRLEM